MDNTEKMGRKILNGFLVILSCLIMGLNINSFVDSAGLYPGGFNGITLLVQRIASTFFSIKIPFSLINYPLNLILLAFSAKILGKRFTFYTLCAILMTGIFTDLLPTITITEDPLLSCVFGGIINGFAIGLCLMANASGGGTDIIGILVLNKFNVDPWNYILVGNVVLLVIAGFLFGWNQALFSIIFQFASTQLVQMMYRKHKRHTLFIVTDKPREVYTAILDITNHSATMLQGEGCYENEKRELVYSVISSMEVKSVLKSIKEVDPRAFVNVIKTDQLDGRFYQN